MLDCHKQDIIPQIKNVIKQIVKQRGGAKMGYLSLVLKQPLKAIAISITTVKTILPFQPPIKLLKRDFAIMLPMRNTISSTVSNKQLRTPKGIVLIAIGLF